MAALLLVSDLSVGISEKSSFVLHFLTEGFDELGKQKGAIGVLLDNGLLETTTTLTFERSSLEAGYHILRAVLLDSSGMCVKSPAAYVEAEFYVGKPVAPIAPVPRKFMFGQPSIFIVSPRSQAPKSEALKVDFYVSNCELSAKGYSVRLYVNNKASIESSSWEPITSPAMATENTTVVELKLCLLRPSGREIKTPEYNQTSLTIQLVP